MCLSTDKRSIKRAEDFRTKSGYKVYWKIVRNSYGDIYSRIIYGFKWKPGWNKSDRTSVALSAVEKHSGQVDHGIHVYTSRKNARKSSADVNSTGYKLIRVKCYNKDCVAFEWDGYEAVYTKVFLARDEWLSAMNGTTRERK